MATTDTIVGCCPASTWCKVIAWLQLIAGAVGIVGWAAALATLDSIDLRKSNIQLPNGLFKAFGWIMLVCSFFSALLGGLLLLGTTKEKLGCLWTWIIFQIIWWVLLFIGLIFQAVQLGFLHILPAVVGSPFFGFLVWLVLRRIKDIKAGSSMGSSKVEVHNRKD